MSTVILSCNTIRAELDQMIEKVHCDYPVIYLESGLHNDPKKLNAAIQKVLDRLSNVERVLLIMGFCGNAVVGLKTNKFNMIIPKADDCLTMLLGSMDRRKEVQREKTTYFLSKGWLDMYDEVEKGMVDSLRSMENRYGKERAERIFRALYKHYERLGVIDTGSFDIESIVSKAKPHSELLQLPMEIIPGTMGFLERFLTGPWDSKYFITIENESIVKLEDTLDFNESFNTKTL